MPKTLHIPKSASKSKVPNATIITRHLHLVFFRVCGLYGCSLRFLSLSTSLYAFLSPLIRLFIYFSLYFTWISASYINVFPVIKILCGTRTRLSPRVSPLAKSTICHTHYREDAAALHPLLSQGNGLLLHRSGYPCCRHSSWILPVQLRFPCLLRPRSCDTIPSAG